MANLINLTPFVSTTNPNVTYQVGQTVQDQIGKGGKVAWASIANFFDTEKKVSVKMTTEKGVIFYLNCSKTLSSLARANKDNFFKTDFFNHLLLCNITESTDSETGLVRQFIGLPEGYNGKGVDCAIDTLKAKPFIATQAELEATAY